MNSTIGRSPVMAAPMPMPEKPASEIGVSITRRGPNLSSIPSETLYAPLYWPTSSPMRKTFSSRSISSVIAWRRASRNWISGMFFVAWAPRPCGVCAWARCPCHELFLERILLGKDVGIQLARVRVRRAVGELHGVVDDRANLAVVLLDRRVVELPALFQPVLVEHDRVAAAPAVGLFLGAVLHRVRHRVAAVAVRVHHQVSRPLAAP